MNNKLYIVTSCLLGMILGYFLGYSHAVKNKVIDKVSYTADRINGSIDTISSFPDRFSTKVDETMDEIRSWFKFRKGPNGEIILDENSPIFSDIKSSHSQREN